MKLKISFLTFWRGDLRLTLPRMDENGNFPVVWWNRVPFSHFMINLSWKKSKLFQDHQRMFWIGVALVKHIGSSKKIFSPFFFAHGSQILPSLWDGELPRGSWVERCLAATDAQVWLGRLHPTQLTNTNTKTHLYKYKYKYKDTFILLGLRISISLPIIPLIANPISKWYASIDNDVKPSSFLCFSRYR